MRTRALRGPTALVAAVLVATVFGASASARNFSISNQNIRVTWARLEFADTLVIRCPLTLEGSLHSRTFPKVAGTQIGTITRAVAREASCTNGQVAASGVPWNLTYESFSGTLPNITTIRVLISRFLLRTTFVERRCTYGTATNNITFSASINGSSELIELVPVMGRNILILLEGTFLCPAERTFAGSAGEGIIALLNTTTKVRLTLI